MQALFYHRQNGLYSSFEQGKSLSFGPKNTEKTRQQTLVERNAHWTWKNLRGRKKLQVELVEKSNHTKLNHKNGAHKIWDKRVL